MRRAALLVLVGCTLLTPPGAFARFGIMEGGTVRVDNLAVREC
jgi:hypothetical protein